MSTTNILDLNNRIDALEKIAHNVEPIQQQIDELKAWTDPGTKDASGNPITLTDGSAWNAEGLVVTLEPKQSGSGTPSPENVRPITGYTECVVDRDGKNLLPLLATTRTVEGITYTVNDDGTVTMNNTATGLSYLVLSNATNDLNDLSNVLIKAGTPIIVSTGIEGKGVVARYTDGSFENLSSGLTFTPNKDIALVYIQYGSGTVLNNVKLYPMIRLASVSDDTFVPYSHDTATIAFGQTVYGGSVDFKTGKVTVTHASIASYNGESINEPWLSSIDEYVSGTTPTTGAQVVYPLTEPTVLTLTPAELELLKGYNYITTNGTNIELTYLPDTLKADILLTVSQLYGSKISIFDGILTGGDTGQVLTKTSDDNYDATWATLPATRTTTKKSEK